jgi:HAE1 family hydrophobic/amphiphilic exporter-1
MLAKLQTLPELRDVASDQQAAGTTLTIDFRSRSGVALRTDGADDRRHARRRLRPAPDRPIFHAALELRSDHGGAAELQNDLTTLDRIFLKSPTTGGEVPLSVFAKWTTTPIQPLSISHQGQFPAVTISFNLAPGVALGQATGAIQSAQDELKLPPTVIASFQGNAQAFQDSLSTSDLADHRRAGGRLPDPRHPL